MAAHDKGRPPAAASGARGFRFAGLGTALVGAALLVGTVLVDLRDAAREKTLVAAPGTVIEQRARGGHGTSETRIVLTVRFTTAAGQTVRFERAYGERETRPARGDAVTVLYDPERPTRAEIRETSGTGRVLLPAVGATLLLIGAAVLTWTFRERRRAG